MFRNVLIDLGLNESDGFGFNEFTFELFYYNSTVEHCDDVAPSAEFIHVTVSLLVVLKSLNRYHATFSLHNRSATRVLCFSAI